MLINMRYGRYQAKLKTAPLLTQSITTAVRIPIQYPEARRRRICDNDAAIWRKSRATAAARRWDGGKEQR
jgi:hypothetical protein